MQERLGDRLLDWALVVVLAAVTAWHAWVARDIAGPAWLLALLPLLLDLPLARRRRAPLAVTAVVAAGIALQAVAGGQAAQGLEMLGPAAVALFSVAAYTGRRPALAGLVIVAAAALANEVRGPGEQTAAAAWADGFWALGLLALWLAGRFVRARRESAALAARATELERELQAAVGEERARIARELHDIVSHNLSVVVVQAAGARALVERRAQALPGPLETIERSGREALQEMRRLLGVLREGAQDEEFGPQPGLERLPELAETMRAAGLEVELELDARTSGLPAALGLCVYRIVQEALTNTLKHADATRARVSIRCEGGRLLVHVADDGAGTPAAAVTGGSGHGLVGMRERVALFGGELTAAAGSAGGFVVDARLPLEAPA